MGSFFGVPVYANVSLFVTAALVAVAFLPAIESVDSGLGSRKYLVAALFAGLLYLSILGHELAHAVVARGFGLPVRSVTLYMLGGVTALDRPPGTPWRSFAVSAAGPLTTLVIAAAGWAGLLLTDQGTLAHLLLFQVTAANLFVGIYNLLPGLPLDGGSMLAAAVWKVSGRETTGTLVGAWAGRVVALLTVALPFLIAGLAGGRPDPIFVLWSAVIGLFLWSGSTQALRSARVRARLPALTVLGLVRPALAVPADTPLGEALRRLADAGARALVVADADGRTTGLVNEAAVRATPLARRPWVTVGEVSRRLDPGLVLRTDLAGEALIEAMQATPASEYLVVEPDGSVRGVLTTADVEASFAGA